MMNETPLSDTFEIRKFCDTCNAAPKFCKCKEPRYAVWLHAISGDLAEAVKDLKEELNRRLFFDDGSKQYCDYVIDKIFGLQDNDGGKNAV